MTGRSSVSDDDDDDDEHSEEEETSNNDNNNNSDHCDQFCLCFDLNLFTHRCQTIQNNPQILKRTLSLFLCTHTIGLASKSTSFIDFALKLEEDKIHHNNKNIKLVRKRGPQYVYTSLKMIKK